MGDAGVATSPDGNSAHWNAAKLVFIDKGIRCVSILYAMAQEDHQRYVDFLSLRILQTQ